MLSSQSGTAPCKQAPLYSHVAELPADAPGLLGAARALVVPKSKAEALLSGIMGMEGAELQPVVPWQAADGIHACDLAASPFLEEKGKNKKTRNLYLHAIKIYLNRSLFLHFEMIYILHVAHIQSTSVTCHSTMPGQSSALARDLELLN